MGHFPFGEQWYNTTGDKLMFTSYERDSESGNDYAMARYNINRLGRFSSTDPLSGSIAAPQSLNRYAYALNEPISLVDPLGLMTCAFGIYHGTSETGHWWDLYFCDSDKYKPSPMTSSGEGGSGGYGSGPHIDPKSRCAELFAKLLGLTAEQFNSLAQKVPWFYSPNANTFGTLSWDFISGNGDKTPISKTFTNTSVTAATASGGSPTQPAPVVLGPDWFMKGSVVAEGVKLHEAVHSITGWNDARVFNTFSKYGLPNADWKQFGNTAEFDKWLMDGCPPKRSK